MWKQKVFDPRRDYWALDSVRIFKKFGPGWKSSSAFLKNREARLARTQTAQCCFNTERCNKFSTGDHPDAYNAAACESVMKVKGNFKKFMLRGSDLFVSLGFGIAVTKLCMQTINACFRWILWKVCPSDHRVHAFLAANEEEGVDYGIDLCTAARREFRLCTNSSWRMAMAIALVLPIAFSSFQFHVHDSTYTLYHVFTSRLLFCGCKIWNVIHGLACCDISCCKRVLCSTLLSSYRCD
mmetsp:Transcript_32553/g.74898  ORF Transcript_32553/g.74898 Transcript_32553/m.74898 type:complete len:239 (-) Transcript_32553:947-1663(-)